MNIRVVIFAFFFISLTLSAQQEKLIDSLERVVTQQPDSLKIHTYSELVKVLVRVDIEKAKGYLDKEVALAASLKKPSLNARARMDEGNYYSVKANFAEAEKSYNEAIEFYDNANDSLSMAKVFNNMSRAMFYQGNIEGALDIALKAARINERLNPNRTELIGNYLSIGNTQSSLGRYESSLEYYRKAEAIALSEDNALRLAQVRHNIGENMKWLERYSEALPYFNNNVEYYTSANNEYKLANTYNSLGTVYFEMDSIEKAKPYFEQSYALSKKLGIAQGLAFNARNLGRISLKENDPQKALDYYSQGMNHSLESNSTAILVQDYNNVSTAYYALGDYKNAYDYKSKHQVLNDSVYKMESIEKLSELEVKYQTEKKEATIKTLSLQTKNDKLTKTLYGIGMVSFIAIAGLLYFGFRQRIKKNKIAQEKQEAILKQEIEFKKKELTSQTLHLVQKNTFINELKDNLEKIKQSPELFKVEFRRLVLLLRKESAEDKDWEVFKSYFSEVHNNFDNTLKSINSDISEKEIRLASFLRMNLTTKEIASMLNVLPDSVLKSKYRLKKKLGIEKEQDLSTYLNTL